MNNIFYKSGYEWYMNKALCENLQNKDGNKPGTFGVCAAEVEIFGSANQLFSN